MGRRKRTSPEDPLPEGKERYTRLGENPACGSKEG